jgi:hypothetical protein
VTARINSCPHISSPAYFARLRTIASAASPLKRRTRCGLDFFGADHVLFASDFPFDAEGGKYLVRETIRALDELELSVAVRQKIDRTNTEALIDNAKRRYAMSIEMTWVSTPAPSLEPLLLWNP